MNIKQTDFNEYGFDQVLLSELLQRINTEFNIDITLSDLQEHSNIRSLTHFLQKKYGKEIQVKITSLYKTIEKIEEQDPILPKKKNILEIKEKINKKVQNFLIETISKILKISQSKLQIEQDIGEYGFDSISFTELANKINAQYKTDLTPALFYEYSTVKSLSSFLLNKYQDKIYETYKDIIYIGDDQLIKDVVQIEEPMQKSDYKRFIQESYYHKADQSIAIIGMAGILPGGDDLDEFWENLLEKKDCITEVPPDRWDWKEYWGDPTIEENKTNVKWGGFIKNIDKFDAGFFNISPREAILMDPQQRLFLEIVWKIIEDAGYKASDFYESLTGVFVGVQNAEYADLLLKNDIPVEAYFSTGNSHAVLPNRISYLFNLNGPSEAIDAACASSLIAIHRAIQSIIAGDCKQAIAGGVNSLLTPETFISLNKAGALSQDGRCKTFSKDANGYARAEGVGAILLKPLSDAIKDGDHIYAVIKGSAENHGGKAKSLTAPNPNAQADLIIKAMERAQVDPSTITYIEAHGTGTNLGDPIEINSLIKAYTELYSKWNKNNFAKNKHCGISSVKTNIGHLETGAGIAGVLKVLLSMKNRKLPGTVHFNEINPYIDLGESPFFIVKDTQEWQHLNDETGNKVPYRAGISSFGFGGANAHVVLEEYIPEKPVISVSSGKEYLIILSAKTESSLKAYADNLKQWLENNKNKNQLHNIECTLLFGREELEERFAIAAKDEKDLIEKLKAFSSGKDGGDNFFTGNIKKEKIRSVKVLDDEEGKEYITKLINNRKLKKIAELWVSGFSIDWKLFLKDTKAVRISLPTYPFEKKRYWIEKPTDNRQKQGFGKYIHPLIDYNDSNLYEQKFVKEFSGKEIYLADHVVIDKKVLPGVVYLEYARAAGEAAIGKKITRIKNVIWRRPFVVDRSTKELNIRLYPADSKIMYDFYSTTDNGKFTITYSQGELFYNEIDTGEPDKFDIDSLQKELTKMVESDTCYAMFQNNGLNYGESFRVIKKIQYNQDSVLGYLEIDDELLKKYQEYTLIPSLMDGALQSIIGLDIEGNKTKTYLPFSLRSLEIFRPLAKKCIVFIQKNINSVTESDIVEYNLHILDETGNVLVKLYNFVVKELKQLVSAAMAKEEISHFYIKDNWVKSKLEENVIDFKSILVLDTDEKLYTSLKSQYTEANIILIKPGNEYKEINEIQYEINLNNQNNYTQLFRSIQKKGVTVQKIIHNISKEDFSLNIEKQVEQSIYSLFYLCKELFSLRLKDSVQILYLYNKESGPVYNGISGFARSACLENSKIQMKLIGFDKESALSILKIIAGELKEQSELCEEISYKDEERLKKHYVELDFITESKEECKLKENGIYVITGGAGGLGLLFAEYIARQVQSRLILTGRSELTQARKEKMGKIESLGATVTYIKADVTKQNDIKNLVKEVKTLYGKIDGVIHAAGLIKDNYIIKKTIAEVQAVIGPKVYGTLYLDEILKDEKLDFFVLFSSMAAMGNVGQSDYAFANSFMDSFAEMRNSLVKKNQRFGKTLSINWPLWKEGGMYVDKETEKYLFNSLGMIPLTTKTGTEAFIKGLSTPVHHFTIVEGDAVKIKRKLHIHSDKNKSLIMIQKQGTNNEELLRSKVEDGVIDIIIDILRIEKDTIDRKTNISEFGFDSISFTELANKINVQYQIDITPAIFYEYSTVDALNQFLIKEYNEEIVLSYPELFKAESTQAVGMQEIAGIEMKEQLRVKVIDSFIEIVSGILKVSKADIDPEQNISEYGFDSITFTELSNQVNMKFAIDITPALFYEYSTIEILSVFILDTYHENLYKIYKASIQTLKEQPANDRQAIVQIDEPEPVYKRFVQQVFTDKAYLHEPVAIIGMAGIMPGAENLDKFWKNLEQGKDCISEIPPDRWDWREYWGDPSAEDNKTNVKWGGFIKDVDKFDAQFFSISPREVIAMDPQQRLFLEIVWKTIEDAGYNPYSLSDSYTGLFVGVGTGDYSEILDKSGMAVDSYMSTGNAHSVLPNRISYLLNLHGPSEPINTACSSSLIALHRAVFSIHAGECVQAIVGGVNLNLSPKLFISFNKAGMLCEDGRCKTFDAKANGYVRGEGVGAIFLKPLSMALKDKDHIYAVIKGTAENHGGLAKSLTAPNPNAQSELIVKAMEIAKVDPSTITCLEAHGTGTSLGDPIEINGLKKAYKELYSKWNKGDLGENKHCGISSVKTNIGHLETAAGIAGILKILLSMKNKKLPKTVHFNELNPYIKIEDSPFYIVKETEEWKHLKDERGNIIPYRAGISSFGFGGANAHVVLEEYIPEEPMITVSSRKEYLIILSAKTESSLKAYADNLKQWLEKNKGKEQLYNIEYTLLMGREELEERLALIGTNEKDCIAKLKAFCNGKDNIDGLIAGSAEKKKDKADKIIDAVVGQDVIEKLIANENLEKLAGLWVSGYTIDWKLYLKETKATKISLPTYPFEKKRYWVEEQTDKKQRQDHGKYIHPLIDYNDSNLYEQKFVKEFTGREIYLADHIVNGQKVLPEVIYLEYARAAGEAAIRKKIVQIKNVEWKHPFIIDVSEKELNIRLYPGENNILYDIYSINDNEVYTITYGQGELCYHEIDTGITDKFDIDLLKSDLSKTIEAQACYELFHDCDFEYGKSFRVIKKIQYNQDKALAYLEIDDELFIQYKEYTLIPSLVDGAFQGIISFMIEENDIKTYLPFSLGSLCIIQPLVKRCIVYIQRNTDSVSETDSIGYNLHILDEMGNVLITMQNFVVKELKQLTPSVKVKGEINHFYIKENWIESKLIENITNVNSIMLFDTDDKLSAGIEEQFAEAKVILVKPGDVYREIDDVRYEINLNILDNYTKLLKSIKEKGIAVQKIIHNISKTDFTLNNTEKQVEQSFFSLFYLCKELFSSKSENKVQMLYLYNKESEPVYSGINGFARSACLENTKIQMKLIGYEKDSTLSFTKIIANELKAQREPCEEIFYRGKERLKKQYSEFDFNEENKEECKLVEGGVYIITGGVGGLGLLFAEFIAKHVKVKLILTGRSQLKKDRKKKIKKIENLGAEVVYIQADVTKEKDIENLVKEVKTLYSRINGIIHAAGLIRDNYIIKKPVDEVRSVIGPKVYGTLYLDKVLKAEKLDFFVYFSSMAAMGNAGQCDYAFANSFMDYFAEIRNSLVKKNQRFGKALSINWPLWKEGGMHVDEQTEEYVFNSTGMVPLSSETGIETFITGLASTVNHFAVVEGDVNRIKKKLNLHTGKIKDSIEIVEQKIYNKELLQSKVDDKLMEMIIGILKIEKDAIIKETDINELGFDSISFTELANKINTQYKTDITPALFYEYSTVENLSAFLLNMYPDNLCQVYKDIIQIGKKQPINDLQDTIQREEPKPESEYKRFIQDTIINKQNLHEPIAIIGMAGIMPGAENLNEFWKNLEQGKDSITEIPPDRWDWREYWGDPATEENKTNVKWGGFIKDVDKFDARFFNISPKEAELMDPQQRLFLEIVWKTIEDAGYKPSDLSGTNTAVFVGVGSSDYGELLIKHQIPIDVYNSTGTTHSILANRISYLLNLNGPSEIVDTACSTALVALHRATKALRYGECTSAIVGCTHLLLSPAAFITLDKMNILSHTGKCKSFDEKADGYAKGEGIGAVLLKPLKKAIKDNNHIYAIIKGTAINHNGRSKSLTSPSPIGISRVIIEAVKDARIDPATISYIEAHGTGTNLGDTLEINGLKKAYTSILTSYNGEKYCGIGTVKTNIGHLEVASGMAGLFKIILSMQNSKLPGLIHFNKLNSYIKLENTPFYIVDKLQKWEHFKDKNKNEIPFRAGLSSFGFGGVNGHIILEEYRENKRIDVLTKREYLFIFSAKTKESLNSYTLQLIKWIKENQQKYPIADIIYTLQTGRDSYKERVALIVSDYKDIFDKLTDCSNNRNNKKIFYSEQDGKRRNKIDGFFNDETGKTYIEQILKIKDLNKIAQLWTLGFNIDFNLLYSNKSFRLVPLPTYQFDRKSYWFKDVFSIKIKGKLPPVEKQDAGKVSTKLNVAGSGIRKIVSDLTKIPEEDIDNATSLDEFGVDSLLFIELVKVIQREYNLKLELVDIANLNTIDEWNKFILNIKDKPDKIKKDNKKKPVKNKKNRNEDRDKLLFEKYKTGFKDFYPSLDISLIKSSSGLEIERMICGSGEPILILLGLCGIFPSLNKLIIRLSEYYKVIVFHYPGHGRSEYKKENSALENIVDSIVKDMEKIGISLPFNILGYSMGGMIASKMAYKYPDKVNKMIIVSSAPHVKYDDAFNSLDLMGKFIQNLVDYFKKDYPENFEISFDEMEFLKFDIDNKVLFHYISEIQKNNTFDIIGKISLPTLVIAGELDNMTTPDEVKVLHQQIKNSSYHEVKGGSHFIPMYQYKEVAEFVIGFLQNKI